MSIELIERAVEAGRARHAALAPAVRRAHGVVHTPGEVAVWALAQVDAYLRSDFGCVQGLCDPRVALLDPALGTGVWLAAALARMNAVSAALCAPGPQLLGFDIDGATLTIARALLAPSAERANAGLALIHANMLTLANPWGPALDQHVRVIVGNPPWSARSQSRGLTLSDQWLSEFRFDSAGVSLGERRTGVLSDDYVRFFRWALEQARTSHAGAIVCLATNSSYLDGPVHRGMRAALVKAFDEIEILDLGGNALRGSDGTRDENVFGVRVGTCLTLALRRPGSGPREARLLYRKLQGTRTSKLARLVEQNVPAARSFAASPPLFRFLPARAGAFTPSDRPTFSLSEAFPFHREGVQTNRDAFVTDHDPAHLLARMQSFAEGKVALASAPQLSDPGFRASLRASLASDPEALMRRLAYRPFDDRFCFSLAPFCHRPRPDLARAVAQSSLCLLSARKDRGDGAWNLFGVARSTADGCYLSTRSSCRTRVFPSHAATGAPNLDPQLRDTLSTRVGYAVTSEQLIAYCVGVLASESFRRDHDAELHQDYPRLPWPDASQFAQQRAAGEAWIHAWLDPVSIAGAETNMARRILPIRYDGLRGELHCGEHTIAEIGPELWHFKMGDFAALKQLARSPNLTLCAVLGAIERVRGCVQAAAQAEVAYQLTRPVR